MSALKYVSNKLKENPTSNTDTEVIDFVDDIQILEIDDLLSIKTEYVVKSRKITEFYKEPHERKIKVDIPVSKRDKVIETMMYDTNTEQKGKIYIGDYYLECNLIELKPKKINLTKELTTEELVFVVETGKWIQEDKVNFTVKKDIDTYDYLDFPYDFDYDFSISTSISEKIENVGTNDANFVIDISGIVDNPSITINGHIYEVNTSVGDSEHLIIDSRTSEVYKVDSNMIRFNKFNDRNKDSYIFKKIEPGVAEVTWNNAFNFTLTLYNEREVSEWLKM